MDSELDQASKQSELVEQQNEQQHGRGCRIIIENEQKQLNKSFEILKETVNLITCNPKLIFCMFLSIFPLFSFMLFFDMKLQIFVLAAPDLLQYRSPITFGYSSTNKVLSKDPNHDFDEYRVGILLELLQIGVLWLVIYPLLQTFSVIVTVRVAAKVHAGEKHLSPKEALFSQNNNLKGLSVTCICVQLLSNLTLLGLFWIIANSGFLTNTSDFNLSSYDEFNPVEFCFIVLHTAIYLALFVALFYKYLDWSAFWNMSMVISVMGEETGINSFGMADYYGKHCKKTGFRLMLILFAFGALVRVLCLFAGLCRENVVGIVTVVFSVGLFCLGNLVKWVAFVLYFYDCKQRTLEKKADEEVRKVENASDSC